MKPAQKAVDPAESSRSSRKQSIKQKAVDQGAHLFILDECSFLFDSEDYVLSGWNALRGALEAGGPCLQGANPSRRLELS